MRGSAGFRLYATALAAVPCLVTTGFSPLVDLQHTSSLLPARPERLAVATDDATRMTIPVRLNGRGPYPFVIDTGADRTVVSRELAKTLGLKAGDPVLVNGVGGVDLTPTAEIAELDVGRREIKDISAPTLNEVNLGADGMLGIDSMHDERMVMNFRKHRIEVEPSTHPFFGTDVVVVRARSRYGQLILVDASINGHPIYVILDSGAQNTIGNLALEREVLGPGRTSNDMPVEVISVSGRTTPAHFARLPRVKIGPVKIDNLSIAFADLHTFAQFDLNNVPALLLGMDVLRTFDQVAVDFGRKEVSFQAPMGG